MESPRVGGAALIVASILFLVGNILHPRGNVTGPDAEARLITDNINIWYSSHTMLLLAPLIALLGNITLYQVLKRKEERTYLLPALISAVAGLTLVSIVVVMDGFVSPILSQKYLDASAGAQQSAGQILEYQFLLNLTFLAPAFLGLWLSGGFFGASLVRAKLYNRYFGWAGIVLALVGIVGYVAGLFGPYWVLSVAFVPYSLVFTVWFLVLGVYLYREKSTPA